MIRSYVIWTDNTAILSVYKKSLFKCVVPIAEFNSVWQGEVVSDSWVKILLKGKGKECEVL
jgi:hypothetical protein